MSDEALGPVVVPPPISTTQSESGGPSWAWSRGVPAAGTGSNKKKQKSAARLGGSGAGKGGAQAALKPREKAALRRFKLNEKRAARAAERRPEGFDVARLYSWLQTAAAADDDEELSRAGAYDEFTTPPLPKAMRKLVYKLAAYFYYIYKERGGGQSKVVVLTATLRGGLRRRPDAQQIAAASAAIAAWQRDLAGAGSRDLVDAAQRRFEEAKARRAADRAAFSGCDKLETKAASGKRIDRKKEKHKRGEDRKAMTAADARKTGKEKPAGGAISAAASRRSATAIAAPSSNFLPEVGAASTIGDRHVGELSDSGKEDALSDAIDESDGNESDDESDNESDDESDDSDDESDDDGSDSDNDDSSGGNDSDDESDDDTDEDDVEESSEEKDLLSPSAITAAMPACAGAGLNASFASTSAEHDCGMPTSGAESGYDSAAARCGLGFGSAPLSMPSLKCDDLGLVAAVEQISISETVEHVNLPAPAPPSRQPNVGGRGSRGLELPSSTISSAYAGMSSSSLHVDRSLRGDWEAHTRGVGSRLLAKMGYSGGALGRTAGGARAASTSDLTGAGAAPPASASGQRTLDGKVVVVATASMPEPIAAEMRKGRVGIGAPPR